MIQPMLCKPIKHKLDDENYIIERKFDGIRAIMTVQPDKYYIETRTGQEITHRFPEIEPQFKNGTYILDGELVCFKNNVTDFQAMQARTQREANIIDYAIKYPAKFVVFDCLMVDDIGIMHHPFLERKKLIESYTNLNILNSPVYYHSLALPDYYKTWEGLIYKNKHSSYQEGKRGNDWLKYKFTKTENLWVVGFTHGTGKRQSYFGALIVAELADGVYKYRGQVGTGFTDLDLILLTDNFKFVTDCSDRDYMCRSMTHVSIEPFKAKIEYLESTKAGILRQPAFKGLV